MPEIQDSDFENLGGSPHRILIPPGVYPARFVNRRSDRSRKDWKKEKVSCEWTVYMNPLKSKSVRLSRHYNAERDKAGRFVFGDGTHYRADWIRANGGKHPAEWHRLPITIFKDREFLVEVVTVTQDDQRRPLHPSLYYSKIGRVVRPVNDGETFPTLPIQAAEIMEEGS